MNIWGITDVGAVRHQNQDSYHIELLAEDMALGIVCDGMGGAKAGNVASQLAVETFLETAKAQPPEQWRNEPEALLHFAAEQANGAVHFRANVDADCRGMGTTMVAALDHSVVEDLVARGQITPEQARQHPQKNLITRALGAESRLRADLFRQPMEHGDALLLCSDGLSNMVSDQELLYEVLHGGPAEDCCRRLLDIALSRGAPDNVTAVLLQM